MAIPKLVRERLKSEVPRFQKILSAAHDRDVNEADTVVIITDILSQVFGMDKYSEVTREYAIKGTYVDLAVKLDGKLEYLIEVKAVGTGLKDNHLRQAVNYAATEGIQWVVLTNGIDWEVHRVTVAGKVDAERLVRFNFLELKTRNLQDMETLFMLCKRGVHKDLIADYYERQQACNRFMIGAVLQTKEVVNTIGRVLKRITPGLKIDSDEVLDIIQNGVIKRDIFSSEEGIDAGKKVKRELAKIARQKAKAK